MAESLCCPPKTVTTLLISYTPTLNKKLKNPTQIMVGFQGFPDSSVGKEFVCNSGDTGSIPESRRYTGEGNGHPLQYCWASFAAQLVKNPPTMQETWV